MTIMSGVMNPFDTLVGVVISRCSSSRTLMLPSFEATKPRCHRRRPASTMSALICSSLRTVMARSGRERRAALVGAEVDDLPLLTPVMAFSGTT